MFSNFNLTSITPLAQRYCIFKFKFKEFAKFLYEIKVFKQLFSLTIFLLSTFTLNAQDLEYSQFYAAPLHLNPAFAGVDVGPRFVINYRNQWPGLENAYVSYAASFDKEFKKNLGGVGLLLTSDHLANNILTSNSVTGFYSYSVNLSQNYGIKIGMSAGVIQERLHFDKLIFGGQIDPLTGAVSPNGGEPFPTADSKSVLDIGAGGLLFGKKFYLGLSAKHVTQPDLAFYTSHTSNLPMRIGGNVGYQINLKSKTNSITPNILYAEQGEFHMLNAGAFVKVSDVFGGIFYRSSNNTNNSKSSGDAFIFIVGVQHDFFRFAYSYDVTVSNLASVSGGAHEVSLIFNLHDTKKAKSQIDYTHFTTCPDIF